MIDTAVIDSKGFVLQQIYEVIGHIDIAIIIFDNDKEWGLDKEWVFALMKQRIPVMGVVNKIDLRFFDEEPLLMELNIPIVKISAKRGVNRGTLLEELRKYTAFEQTRKF